MADLDKEWLIDRLRDAEDERDCWRRLRFVAERSIKKTDAYWSRVTGQIRSELMAECSRLRDELEKRTAPKDGDEDAGPVYCCSQHPEHENVRCQIPLGHDGEHQWAGYDKGCRWGGVTKQREVEK